MTASYHGATLIASLFRAPGPPLVPLAVGGDAVVVQAGPDVQVLQLVQGVEELAHLPGRHAAEVRSPLEQLAADEAGEPEQLPLVGATLDQFVVQPEA